MSEVATAPAPAYTPPAEEPRTAMERMLRKVSQAVEKRREAEIERDTAKKEADDLRKQITDLSKATTDTEAIKGELRTLKHRQVTDKLLDEAGINPEAKDAFYKLSEMKFEGEAPDAAKVKAFIEDAKPKLGYLFGGTNGDTGTPRPAAGRGQGGTATPPVGRFEATREQLKDPDWCFAHAAELHAASDEVKNLPVSKVGDKFLII